MELVNLSLHMLKALSLVMGARGSSPPPRTFLAYSHPPPTSMQILSL